MKHLDHQTGDQQSWKACAKSLRVARVWTGRHYCLMISIMYQTMLLILCLKLCNIFGGFSCYTMWHLTQSMASVWKKRKSSCFYNFSKICFSLIYLHMSKNHTMISLMVCRALSELLFHSSYSLSPFSDSKVAFTNPPQVHTCKCLLPFIDRLQVITHAMAELVHWNTTRMEVLIKKNGCCKISKAYSEIFNYCFFLKLEISVVINDQNCWVESIILITQPSGLRTNFRMHANESDFFK